MPRIDLSDTAIVISVKVDSEDRLEFMFIGISVMQADDLIFNSEVDFCKSLAIRLRLDPTLVDVYATRTDIDKKEFMQNAKIYVKD